MRIDSFASQPPEGLGLSAAADNDITAKNMDFGFSNLDLDISELLNADTIDCELTENAGISTATQLEADPYPTLFESFYQGFDQSLDLLQSDLNTPPQHDSSEVSDQKLVLGVNEITHSSYSLSSRDSGTTIVSDTSTQSFPYDSWINITPPSEREDLPEQNSCPSGSDENASSLAEPKTLGPRSHIWNIATRVSHNNWFTPATWLWLKYVLNIRRDQDQTIWKGPPGQKNKGPESLLVHTIENLVVHLRISRIERIQR